MLPNEERRTIVFNILPDGTNDVLAEHPDEQTAMRHALQSGRGTLNTRCGDTIVDRSRPTIPPMPHGKPPSPLASAFGSDDPGR